MEEKRTRLKRKIKIPPIYYVVGGIILLLVIIALYIYNHPSYSTQVVYHGSEEEIISGKAILVWDEELLSSSSKGMAVMNYSDGTRVTARTHVATVYSGEIDEGKKQSIKSLSEKINTLEISIKNRSRDEKGNGDTATVLLNKMKNIAYYAVYGEFEPLSQEALEIENMAMGLSGNNPQEELENLKRQRDDLERSVSGSKDAFYSGTSGLITAKVDGYETIINEKTTQNTDCQLFSNLWNSDAVDYAKTNGNYVFGKIVNNYEATLLVCVSDADAQGITADRAKEPEKTNVLYLKTSRAPEGKIACTVKDMSSNGKETVITLSLSQHLDLLMGERKFEAEFVRKTHSGLRIPKEAIQEDSEGKFVYIVKESFVRKRPVKVLFEKNAYVIIEEDNTNSSNVLLYDLVITQFKNLAEGSPAPNAR